MKLQGVGVRIAGLLSGAGCVAVLVGLLRAWFRAGERERARERQIAALTASLKALQERVAQLSRAAPPRQEIDSISAAAEGAGIAGLREPNPETLAVITAAATAFAGKSARVRSARLAPSAAENVSPWSQQGRVIVQTSHNLRGRE